MDEGEDEPTAVSPSATGTPAGLESQGGGDPGQGAAGPGGQGHGGGQGGAAGDDGVPLSDEPCFHPQWPYIVDGKCVDWMGRLWNTRFPQKLHQNGTVGSMDQRNGTGVFLGEAYTDRGHVDFDAKADPGMLEIGGGGKHWFEVMSWLGDRSDRNALPQPSTRVEIANIADRPRVLVWNYGPHFDGHAAEIFDVGEPWQPDRWYHVAFDWDYDRPEARLEITISIDGDAYGRTVQLEQDSEGPGRFFMFGHVETNSGSGQLHIRNVVVPGE